MKTVLKNMQKLLACAMMCVMFWNMIGSVDTVSVEAAQNDNANKSCIIKEKKAKKNKKNVNNGTPSETSWNQKMVQVVDTNNNGKIIRVAIIDSGVNFSSDINVAVRKNFIEDDEPCILYEDVSGHGTAIAGLIAALDNDEGITGINPRVEIYSARVLDDKLSAPIDRIVAAIDWAIEQKCDILNMSFGISENVLELEQAIERANAAGILMIAAVGNREKIAYPAAYDEVIAVGSVTAEGIPSANSANGAELELMAPGENLVASGIFDGVLGVTGTSFATPHVTGAASILWEENPEMSADYIRALLDYSANLYGDQSEYGNGVIDISYALEINDKFKKAYNKNIDKTEKNKKQKDKQKNKFWGEVIKNIPENEKAVEIFTGVEAVEGMWGSGENNSNTGVVINGHKQLIQNGRTYIESSSQGLVTFTNDQIKLLIKASALADSDSKLKDMDANPYHGFYLKRKNHDDISTQVSGENGLESNYVANYIFLTKVAVVVGNGNSTNSVSMGNIPGLDDSRITSDITGTMVGNTYWSTIFTSLGVQNNNQNKKTFIYGLALHSITDTLAHSTWWYNNGTWKRLSHNDCDSPNVVENRYRAALLVAKNLLNRVYYGTEGQITDFLFSSALAGDFYLKNFVDYASCTNPSLYNLRINEFKCLDYDYHTQLN